jgi:serine/threonine protein kinase
VLGEGSYSTVIEAWDLLSAPRALDAPKPLSANAAIAGAGSAARSAAARNEGRKAYAVKVLDKVHILKEKKQKYVSVEKEALSLLLRHPGVITLFWTFQDRDSLCELLSARWKRTHGLRLAHTDFVLELAPNGELLSFIKRFGSFDSASARHYAAQLVDTIASMHAVGVVHRDIKPENVLLDGNMRIKVADFGSAKITRKKSGAVAAAPTTVPSEAEPQRASSFVGTAEYVSPELLTEKAATEASDWWAFGCVLYQMIAGRPPFKGPNEYQTFQRIIRRDFDYPDAFPADARELVDRLLVLDPTQRLGTGAEGVAEIKAHAFFRGVDWARLWTLEVPPISTGIFQRPRPAAAPEGSTPFDRFGRDAWVEDALASSDEDGDEASGDVSLSGDASHDEASLPPSSAASQARGGAEADDDDCSSSDGPPAPRRRGLSQNGGTGSRRGSHILRVAASIAGIADSARGRSASQQQQQAALGRPVALRHLQNRFSTASMNTSSSSLNNNASEFDTPSGGSRTPAAQLQATSWAALLLPHEALLYACPITQRKAGAFRSTSKRRQLLLTDFPRLLCVKETQDQLLVKSEVILGIPTAASSAASRTASPQHEARTSLRPQTSQDMLRQTSAGPTLGGAETSEPLAASPRLRAVRRDSLPAAASPQLAAGVLDRAPNFMTGIEAKGTRGFVVHTVSQPWATCRIAALVPDQLTPRLQPARSYTYEDPGGDASYWLRSITAAAARGR